MSTRIQVKTCPACHRTYTYNPSIGDFGRICKYCHGIPASKPKQKTKLYTNQYFAKHVR